MSAPTERATFAQRLRARVDLRNELAVYNYALLPQWLQEEANHGRTSFPLYFLRPAQADGLRAVLEREGFIVELTELTDGDDPDLVGPRLSGTVRW